MRPRTCAWFVLVSVPPDGDCDSDSRTNSAPLSSWLGCQPIEDGTTFPVEAGS